RRCSRFRLTRPPDRRLADAVDLGQLCHCLALGISIGGNADHFLVQLPLTTERDALALGPFNAFLAAAADQLALELRAAAHNGHHAPAMARGGVAPAIPERYKATGEPIEFVQYVMQVAAGARQTV